MKTMTLAVGESLDTEIAAAFFESLIAQPSGPDSVDMANPGTPNRSLIIHIGSYLSPEFNGDTTPTGRRWQLTAVDTEAGTATFVARTEKFRAAEAVAAFMADPTNAGKKLTELFRSRGGITITTAGLDEQFLADNPTVIGKIIEDRHMMLWFRRGTHDKRDLSFLLSYLVIVYPADYDYWPGIFTVDRQAIADRDPRFLGILDMGAAMLRGEQDGVAGQAWAALAEAGIHP